MSKAIHQILIQPVLTEKSVSLNSLKRTEKKKYTFKVAMDANKIEIARAVEQLYAREKVKVESVNTMHVRGKERRNIGRRRGMSVGTTPAWKKAVVTLTPDSPGITDLEGV